MTSQKLDKLIFYSLVLYALASSVSIAAANVGVSFALLFTLVRFYKEPVRFPGDRHLIKVIAFFWLTIFLSAIFAYQHPIAFNKWWAYVYRSLPFFLAACFIDTRRKLNVVLLFMVISVTAADISGLWQAAYGKRAVGFASMTMIMAGYLLQMIPLMGVLALESREMTGGRRTLLGAITLMSVAALGFTGTKGAWLGVIAALLLYALMKIRSNKRLAVALLCGLLIIALAGSQIPFIHGVAMSFLNPAARTFTDRIAVWDGAWRMFLDHPLFGVGPANFEEIYLSKYISPTAVIKLGHAHNNFLQMLAENGLIGFVGFVAMYAYFLYYLYKQNKNRNLVATGVFLSTIALLVQGLTEFNFGDSAVIRMFWFLLGLAVASSRIGAEPCEKDTA